MSDLTGKVVVVTGAESGIGAAVAVLAAESGAEVIAVDREPGPGVTDTLDVTDEAGWSKFSRGSELGRSAGEWSGQLRRHHLRARLATPARLTWPGLRGQRDRSCWPFRL